jgi:hypothetical protein
LSLEGYLDGTNAAPPQEIEVVKDDKTMEMMCNPAYTIWVAQD